MIRGLNAEDQATLDALLAQLAAKRPRNMLRAAWYDGRRAVRDLGISTPPQMRTLGLVLGWPAKSIDVLARRTRFQRFALLGDSTADALGGLVDEVALEAEVQQAITSAYIHACSFLVASWTGDGVLVSAASAIDSTAGWDERARSMTSFVLVHERDNMGDPSSMTLYLPGRTITIRDGAVETVDPHGIDGIPVVPMVYHPRLGRPFGSSRISRPVMSITESALRTMLRSEVSAEFYSAPQRWAMGADASMFTDANGNMIDRWTSILGRVWALPTDDDGKAPTVGQFTQMTQQPHMDQLRAWAQLFAGETSIPVGALGISMDSNPTSAEAFEAARDDLLSEAEDAVAVFGRALEQLSGHIYALAGQDAPEVRPVFRDPRYTSKAAAADATMKLVTAFPWMAESDVALELLGFDETTAERLQAERRRAQARASLNALAPFQPQVPNGYAG